GPGGFAWRCGTATPCSARPQRPGSPGATRPRWARSRARRSIVTGSTDGGLALALVATTAYNSGLIVEKQALGQLPAINSRRIVSPPPALGASPRGVPGLALIRVGPAVPVPGLVLR